MAHTDGIDALVPRWDPNNLGKGYSFPAGGKGYDRTDYEKFRAAREAADKARNAKAQTELKKTMEQVSKFIRDKRTELTKPAIRAAALEGQTLTITTPSTCFASVTWESDGDPDDPESGTVTGSFYKGGKVTYDGPMTLDEFILWSAQDSIGGFYNSDVDAF